MTKNNKTQLTVFREEIGLTLRGVGAILDVNPSYITKLENEDIVPSRDMVDKIYDLYNGLVPISVIYWPTHKSVDGHLSFYLSEMKTLTLRASLLSKHPEAFKHAIKKEFESQNNS